MGQLGLPSEPDTIRDTILISLLCRYPPCISRMPGYKIVCLSYVYWTMTCMIPHQKFDVSYLISLDILSVRLCKVKSKSQYLFKQITSHQDMVLQETFPFKTIILVMPDPMYFVLQDDSILNIEREKKSQLHIQVCKNLKCSIKPDCRPIFLL